MKSAMLLAATLALLSGCGTTASSTSFTIPADTAPAVSGYTDEQQDQAAAEIAGGACPMLTIFAIDYGVMRDESRAINEEF